MNSRRHILKSITAAFAPVLAKTIPTAGQYMELGPHSLIRQDNLSINRLLMVIDNRVKEIAQPRKI